VKTFTQSEKFNPYNNFSPATLLDLVWRGSYNSEQRHVDLTTDSEVCSNHAVITSTPSGASTDAGDRVSGLPADGDLVQRTGAS